MKETYKGSVSGKVYAMKGDQVNVYSPEEEISFVEFEGVKFTCRNELLSDVPVKPDTDIPGLALAITKHSTPKQKPLTKKLPQSNLFK